MAVPSIDNLSPCGWRWVAPWCYPHCRAHVSRAGYKTATGVRGGREALAAPRHHRLTRCRHCHRNRGAVSIWKCGMINHGLTIKGIPIVKTQRVWNIFSLQCEFLWQLGPKVFLIMISIMIRQQFILKAVSMLNGRLNSKVIPVINIKSSYLFDRNSFGGNTIFSYWKLFQFQDAT